MIDTTVLKITCGKTSIEFVGHEEHAFFNEYHWEKWCEAVKRCIVETSEAEKRRIAAE